jgi:hypothetical protein
MIINTFYGYIGIYKKKKRISRVIEYDTFMGGKKPYENNICVIIGFELMVPQRSSLWRAVLIVAII